MADLGQIAGLAELRQVLRTSAPELQRQIQEMWAAWRTKPPVSDASLPHLHVITTPSCFEDLHTMAGVAQILAFDGLDTSISFCLPTPAAARLFQVKARHAGFDQVIHVAPLPDPTHVLGRLDPDTLVARMPPDVLITPGFVTALRRVLSGGAGVTDRAGATLARVREVQAETPLTDERLTQPLAPLLARTLPAHGHIAPRLILDRVQRAAKAAPFPTSNHPGPQRRIAETDGHVFLRQIADLAGDALHPPFALANGRPAEARITHADGRSETRDLTVSSADIEPWMLRCYLTHGGAGNPVIRAFADAISAPLTYVNGADLTEGVPVVWGVLRGSDLALNAARSTGRHFLYLDHAYFDRGHGKTYRITINGFEAGAIRDVPDDRAKDLGVALAPWRSGRREIIVCPPTDFFMEAHKCHDWEEQTLTQLKAYTDRPIVIRRKPKPGEVVKPLPEALETAHALVTHSSNVAIEAAVMGTPVFVSPTSAAAPVGLTDLSQIETPVRPDRDAWIAHLAYSQFSMDEIRSGTAWRLLQEGARHAVS